MTIVPFHMASATVRPKPSRRDFWSTTAARRWSALTSAESCTDSTMMRSSAHLTMSEHISCPSGRSEEHTSELQSLMRLSYSAFCLKHKTCTLQTQHDMYTTLHYTFLPTFTPYTQ